MTVKKKITAFITALAVSAAYAGVFAKEPETSNDKINLEYSYDESVAYFGTESVSLFKEKDADSGDIAAAERLKEQIRTDEVRQKIIDGLKNREKGITLVTVSIEECKDKNWVLQQVLNDYDQVYFDILYSHPEIFYAETKYSLSAGGYYDAISIVLTPEYGNIATDEAEELFARWGDAVVSKLITPDMNDFDKALVLHDYLVKTVEYDVDTASSGVGIDPAVNSYNAYGALVDKKAVCQGYALAYIYLLGKVGIEAEFATAKEMGHAWAMVKLDGKYYHVDVTYDDPVSAVTNKDAGVVSHEYFLRSDKSISTSDEKNSEMGVKSRHYGWSTYDNIVCDDTRFDKNHDDSNEVFDKYQEGVASFRYTSDEMKYVDGRYYYIIPKYSNATVLADSLFDGTDLESEIYMHDDENDMKELESSVYYTTDTTVTLKAEPTATPTTEPAPTATPTATPTTEPTPTVTPTATPTTEPTPTVTPTATPTTEPTPTVTPTATPTAEPTPDPEALKITTSVDTIGDTAIVTLVLPAGEYSGDIDLGADIESDGGFTVTKALYCEGFEAEWSNAEQSAETGEVTVKPDGDTALAGLTLKYSPEGGTVTYDSDKILARLYIRGDGIELGYINGEQSLSVKENHASVGGDADKIIIEPAETELCRFTQPENSDMEAIAYQTSVIKDGEVKIGFGFVSTDTETMAAEREHYKTYIARYDADGNFTHVDVFEAFDESGTGMIYFISESAFLSGSAYKAYCLKDGIAPAAMAEDVQLFGE